MSGIRLLDCPKLVINQKITITSKFAAMTSSSTFFWRCFIFLVKFSYWSKFHVNIITGSGVMTLTRNSEIGNTTIWILPNIWRLERVRDTKFGKNVSNEMLLNAGKCQRCSFYLFQVIMGKPTGLGLKLPPPPSS